MRVCPGFRATGEPPPYRARKSELVCGEVDGVAVIAKRVRRPSPLWSWYLAHEVAVYRAFAATPPPVRVPRLIFASDDTLVIERIAGAPLARRRLPFADLPAATVARLIAIRTALRRVAVDACAPPPPAIRAQLRSRLLEDPTSPVGWITDGLAQCERRGLVARAAPLIEAIVAHAPVAFGHGDLLLRNVIADDADLVLVDWECAGDHVVDWDLALLYTQLAPSARGPIDAAIEGEGGPPRRRAFRALVTFALLRELRFLAAFPNPPAALAQRLRDAIADVGADLG